MLYIKFLSTFLLFLFVSTSYGAANQINWAGCGITKKAFMAELAKAYEKKTGIKVNLSGGGATKGIRNAAKGTIDIGGACRVSMEKHAEERDAYQIPVAWSAPAQCAVPERTHSDRKPELRPRGRQSLLT